VLETPRFEAELKSASIANRLIACTDLALTQVRTEGGIHAMYKSQSSVCKPYIFPCSSELQGIIVHANVITATSIGRKFRSSFDLLLPLRFTNSRTDDFSDYSFSSRG
jgi:hypothetical protein